MWGANSGPQKYNFMFKEVIILLAQKALHMEQLGNKQEQSMVEVLIAFVLWLGSKTKGWMEKGEGISPGTYVHNP